MIANHLNRKPKEECVFDRILFLSKAVSESNICSYAEKRESHLRMFIIFDSLSLKRILKNHSMMKTRHFFIFLLTDFTIH